VRSDFFGWQGGKAARWTARGLVLAGGLLGCLITAAFAGVFYDFELPDAYRDYYEGYVRTITP
jgi:hypothetical protein